MKNRFQRGFLFNEAGSGGEGSGEGGGGGGSTTIINTPGTGGAPGDQPWFHSLPDEFKTNPYVAQSKDLGSFVKSAIDTKSMVGADTIKRPGEKATPEERGAFYDALGRPKDHTGYVPTVKPTDGTVDPAVNERMAKKFHELGLSQAQGAAILDEYYTVLNDGHAQYHGNIETRRNEAITELKGEWGQDFDNNVKTAQLALRELGGGTELFEVLDRAGLGDHPGVIKFLYTAGSKLLDDTAKGGGENRFTGSVEGATAEIARLKQDKEFMDAWGNAQHPGHKDAIKKWEDLHRQAFPGKQTES